MIGETISHYRIIEKLGEGGMGVVYRAEDTTLHRSVALKFLSSHTLGTEQERERFSREARAAAALDHPNIGTIYEIAEADGRKFIAMAYVQGLSLKDKFAFGPTALPEALDIAIDIARGLEAEHEKGIIHRDIKSANIMLTRSGQVKIMDFGLAKVGRAEKLTKTGVTVGTVAYMSPEQTRGKDVDHRTDIWALGVLLHEMVSGELPFNGSYPEAVIYNLLHETPSPIGELRGDLPPAHSILGRSYEQIGKYDEAVAAFQSAINNFGVSPSWLAALARSYGVAGQPDRAREIADRLVEASKSEYVSPYSMALLHSGMEAPSSAMDFLEQAYREDRGSLNLLGVDPRLDNLREDERFVALLEKTGPGH